MNPTYFHRQLDIVNPSELARFPVTVIGAGGIGSPTVRNLAKMGVEDLTVFDGDKVEPHNLPNQLYRLSDVGKYKVTALAEIVAAYAEVKIKTHARSYVDQKLAGIVISGVDSMAARQTIWGGVKLNPNVGLYIEARLGGEVGRIYTLNPLEPGLISWYEETLYSDTEALPLPCTARIVIYTAELVAALIANQLKKFVKDERYPHEIIADFTNVVLLTQDATEVEETA